MHLDLIAERARHGQPQSAKSWAKRLAPLVGLGGVSMVLLAGLEAAFHRPSPFGWPVKIVSLVIILAGYVLASSALIENRFLSGMLRIQSERGHQIVSRGPCTTLPAPRAEGDHMRQLEQRIGKLRAELTSTRRDLHRRPELGFQEYQTATQVARYMAKLGLEVTTGIGGTGVIGLLRGKNPGPTIALRACLDALPITEQSGVAYSSENSGVMHACGHDGNMTMVLGAANILAQYRDQLNGNVKFIFQPSEEDTGGAAEIIKAGGLRAPAVDAIVTLHNWHGLRQGRLAVKSGLVMASSDVFQLRVIGKPGHGAWPHLAVDPIVVAADVISQLQRIISREIDPLKAAAITIGKVYGGTAVNVIPETVTLDGTVRTFDPDLREFIQTRIEEIARGTTQAARATYALTYKRVMPPVNNDVHLAAQVYDILRAAFEPGMVTNDLAPVMGCEEFALFQEQIPGLFLYIGNDREGCDVIPIHSPHYVFNDEILGVGVKALCEIVFGYESSAR